MQVTPRLTCPGLACLDNPLVVAVCLPPASSWRMCVASCLWRPSVWALCPLQVHIRAPQHEAHAHAMSQDCVRWGPPLPVHPSIPAWPGAPNPLTHHARCLPCLSRLPGARCQAYLLARWAGPRATPACGSQTRVRTPSWTASPSASSSAGPWTTSSRRRSSPPLRRRCQAWCRPQPGRSPCSLTTCSWSCPFSWRRRQVGLRAQPPGAHAAHASPSPAQLCFYKACAGGVGRPEGACACEAGGCLCEPARDRAWLPWCSGLVKAWCAMPECPTMLLHSPGSAARARTRPRPAADGQAGWTTANSQQSTLRARPAPSIDSRWLSSAQQPEPPPAHCMAMLQAWGPGRCVASYGQCAGHWGACKAWCGGRRTSPRRRPSLRSRRPSKQLGPRSSVG